jgi:hypothetical protein
VSDHGEVQATEKGAVPGTVWRVSLTWPATDAASRQERVDGLQQLLSARSVVGLMGPGRPTRQGLIVDLVLPVDRDRIMTAQRDGVLEPGPDGEEFAKILHRYTGAVVVNGDVARGDFAVLAAGKGISDENLAQLLDEPINDVLLVGTPPANVVTAAAGHVGLPGWFLDGERPSAAFPEPQTDPTTMLMPGRKGISVALRERAGRLDVLVWSTEASDERPSRRARSARRNAVVSAHLGSRCRPIVLPEYVRPAGSAVSDLLLTLDEDFAPLPASALTRLGRILPAARVDALARLINEAPTLGYGPEDGVLAPEQDGLLPGQIEEAEPEPPVHHHVEEVLRALGEDPDLTRLLIGTTPRGGEAQRIGDPTPSAISQAALDVAATAPTGDAANAADAEASDAEGTESTTAPAAADASDSAADEVSPGDEATHGAADEAPEDTSTTVLDQSQTPPTQANAVQEQGGHHGGFDSLLRQAEHEQPKEDFDQLVSGRRARNKKRKAEEASAALGADADGIPAPRPAVGTPASSAGDDGVKVRGRAWPLIMLILGIVLVIAGVVLVFVAPSLGVATGSGYLIAAAVGIVGLGCGIFGGINLRR